MGVRVLVVVDAAEREEQRDGGPQLGEELALAGAHPLEDGGQQPLPDDVLGQVRRRVPLLRRRERDEGPAQDGHPAARRRGRDVVRLDPVAEAVERGRVQGHRADRGEPLGGRKVVDQAAGEDVDQLDPVVADDEPAGLADRDGDLGGEAHRRPAGGADLPDVGHRLLHGQTAGDGPQPVVAVQPARDGVAAEVDDVPAVRVQPGQQGLEDPAEDGAQLVRAAARAELGRQRLGERGEPGDVDEQGRPAHAGGQVDARGDRPSPVTCDVRLRVVRHRPWRSLPVSR